MILLVFVAVLWGITNGLMKKYVKGIEKVEEQNFLKNLLNEFLFIVYNWKYLLSFGANQMGSLLYYHALGQYDLSLASPLTNAMTLAFTYISDKVLFAEESKQNIYEKVGLLFVCCGVLICFYEKM